jgi:hypothetical protein
VIVDESNAIKVAFEDRVSERTEIASDRRLEAPQWTGGKVYAGAHQVAKTDM